MDYFAHGVILWLANLLDILGSLVIASSAIIVFVNYWRRLLQAEEILRLSLARGLAFGLEFKLGGEILRTVAVRNLNEVYVLGAIILLRATMSLLIHWEIRLSLGCLRDSED